MQYPNIAQPQYAFAPTMPMMAAGGKVQAENVQAQGRGKDTMLVHMTPNEVAGLQALAMRHGGSLTINPKTGLPEAGFLEDILPTLLGVGLSFIPGVGPMMAAGLVGGGTAIATGDISKGLMAGLGAFGGANLAAGLGAAGASAAPGAVTPELVTTGAGDVSLASSFTGPSASSTAPLIDGGLSATGGSGVSAGLPPKPGFMDNLTQAGRGLSNVFDFSSPQGTQAREAFIGKAADDKTKTPATGLGGTMGAIKTAGAIAAPGLAPKPFEPPKEEASTYEGPYTPTPREVRFPTAEDKARIGTSEFQYFSDVNPVPGFQPFSATQTAQPTQMGLAQPIATPMMTDEERRRMGIMAMAKGGSVPQLENGGFVLTKKAVDGLGRGSNDKGQRVASRGLGAIPIKGPGTGTSDSIPTTIDGKHPARISNGEAYVPKDKVKKHGGAKKFYALMKKAERAAA